MTNQSQTLYRKWRSQTFTDLVGQDAVTQTLRQAVATGRLTHAYLFCGPRGTGKTSSARLLAKMVNCATPNNGEPCNVCLSCREITEGRSTDVFEIDAASNRGIDEIRELRDRVRVMSGTGRTRMFIVDECFQYDELVTLADGTKEQIGKIVESGWQGEVLSYNEQSKKIEPKLIVRHMKKPTVAPTVRIVFDNQSAIICTINHKFYTPQGKVCAGHLEVGQSVYVHLAQTEREPSGLAVSRVTAIAQVPGPDYVYNIEVADNHNYFVRDMLVANCHMLTVEAFNALLKTLEEPPPNVMFVLATTEAHKIPATVLSRCQRFDFRRISLRDIVGRLQYISDQEEMRVEPTALELVARAAQGGMRDALSLLDQARAFSGDAISAEAVRQMLGMADPALVRELVTFVASGDTAAGLHRINEFTQNGTDLRQLTAQIAELWRQLMLARAGADVATLLDLSAEDATALHALSEPFALEMLTECARIFARNDVGSRSQVVPQLALELSFLDCVATVHRHPTQPTIAPTHASATRPTAPVSAMRESEPMYAPRTETVSAPPPPVQAPVVVVIPDAPALSQPQQPSIAPTPPTSVPRSTLPTPTPFASSATPHDAAPPLAAPAVTPPKTASNVAAVYELVRNQWETIKKACKQSAEGIIGHRVAGLLEDAQPYSAEAGNPITIVFVVDHDFHRLQLSQFDKRQITERAISAIIEQPCTAHFILRSDVGDMPADVPPVAESSPAPSQNPPAVSPASNDVIRDSAPPLSPSASVAMTASDDVVLTPPSVRSGSVAAVASVPAAMPATRVEMVPTPTSASDVPQTIIEGDAVIRGMINQFGARVTELRA